MEWKEKVWEVSRRNLHVSYRKVPQLMLHGTTSTNFSDEIKTIICVFKPAVSKKQL